MTAIQALASAVIVNLNNKPLFIHYSYYIRSIIGLLQVVLHYKLPLIVICVVKYKMTALYFYLNILLTNDYINYLVYSNLFYR